MIVGLYTSASGMLAEASRHEALANNLANVSTVGFKRDTAVLRQEPVQALSRLGDHFFSMQGFGADLAPGIGSRGQGTLVEAILTDFQQGRPMETGNPADFMLEGEGFFTVKTMHGLRYTRQGNFSLGSGGRLMTMAGEPVLTTAGAEIAAGNSRLTISEDGIIYLDGQEAGRLAVVVPDGPNMLVKEGEGRFAPAPGARFRASGARIVQGTLERSNVNPVMEMAEMLKALRAYEANQRAIMAHDETLNSLISQVGRFG